MIQKFDTEGFTGVFQPFCDLDIFPAWCKPALIFFNNSDAGTVRNVVYVLDVLMVFSLPDV
jgi:hypothetical protein